MHESPRPRRPPLGTGDTERSHVRPAGELAAQRWPILQVIGQDAEPHFPRRLSLSLDVQPGPGRRCRVRAGGSAGTLRQGRGHHERVGTSRPPGLGARAGAQAEVAPGTERPVARSERLQPHRVSRRGQGSLRTPLTGPGTPLLPSGKAREPPAPRSPALCSPGWTENPSSDLCFEKHPEQPKATNCLLNEQAACPSPGGGRAGEAGRVNPPSVLVLGAVIQAPKGHVIKHHPSALGMSQERERRAPGSGPVDAAQRGLGWRTRREPPRSLPMSWDPRSHQAEDSRSLACTAVRAPWGPGSPLHTHAWARDKPSPASGFGVLSPGLYSFLITPQPPELPGRARGPWTRWTETHLRTRDGKAAPPPTASAQPTAHVTQRWRIRAWRWGCRHPQGCAPPVSSPHGPPAL